jgi:hypothetical protein
VAPPDTLFVGAAIIRIASASGGPTVTVFVGAAIIRSATPVMSRICGQNLALRWHGGAVCASGPRTLIDKADAIVAVVPIYRDLITNSGQIATKGDYFGTLWFPVM